MANHHIQCVNANSYEVHHLRSSLPVELAWLLDDRECTLLHEVAHALSQLVRTAERGSPRVNIPRPLDLGDLRPLWTSTTELHLGDNHAKRLFRELSLNGQHPSSATMAARRDVDVQGATLCVRCSTSKGVKVSKGQFAVEPLHNASPCDFGWGAEMAHHQQALVG